MNNIFKNKKDCDIVYLSMEIALENDIKTYAGGLGILAGDMLRSAADLRIPITGVTLLSDQGYFKQKISAAGEQKEVPDSYSFAKLRKLTNQVTIKIGQDKVKIGAWEYLINGRDGHQVPVYLLDAKIEGNLPKYYNLTGRLYNTDQEYRLMQEIILGRAGVKMIKSLGYKNIKKYHVNEGHGSLAAVELFLESKGKTIKNKIDSVKNRYIFTTHTPIKAGHDVFPLDFMMKYQTDFPANLPDFIHDQEVNMTKVSLYFSSYINGVALSHKEVSKKMFPDYPIYSITNGVHSGTWVSPDFEKVYDKYLPNWRKSSLSLRNAFSIPLSAIWEAHQKSKKKLLNYIYKKQKIKLDENIFTIGFARRFTGYKRSHLLFHDMKKLLKIHHDIGKMQIIYAGKAHPEDDNGKLLIKHIFEIKNQYQDQINIIFLEDYDMDLAKLMVAGVDIWLNTPLPPLEASGTSGMKAAHNGVPHFSTLDGWWAEGYIRDKTGWKIGVKSASQITDLDKSDADSLYHQLETRILPRYYQKPKNWRETMCHTIAVNASFFNTERMLQQYIQEAYL